LRDLASCAGFFVFNPRQKQPKQPFSRVQVKNTTARATTPRSVILIASPDAQLRARWRRALRGRVLVYEAGEKSELVHALANLEPAVLLLDFALHRLGGVHALPSIQRFSPETRIIVFCTVPKITEEICALKLGARGYSKKNIGPSLLTKAINVVVGGELWTGRKIISSLLEEVRILRNDRQRVVNWEPKSPIDQLTTRKKQIAQMINEDASNEEIASRLGISKATVKAHLTEIFRKLKITNRLQLAVLMAVQGGTSVSSQGDPSQT
jgi:DNA-binding NarL/FixJ family response regulator